MIVYVNEQVYEKNVFFKVPAILLRLHSIKYLIWAVVLVSHVITRYCMRAPCNTSLCRLSLLAQDVFHEFVICQPFILLLVCLRYHPVRGHPCAKRMFVHNGNCFQ